MWSTSKADDSQPIALDGGQAASHVARTRHYSSGNSPSSEVLFPFFSRSSLWLIIEAYGMLDRYAVGSESTLREFISLSRPLSQVSGLIAILDSGGQLHFKSTATRTCCELSDLEELLYAVMRQQAYPSYYPGKSLASYSPQLRQALR